MKKPRVTHKFYITIVIATLWSIISVILAKNWISDLSNVIYLIPTFIVVFGIAIIPGWLNCFLITSIIVDKQPNFTVTNPDEDVTILVACYNEEKCVKDTLECIHNQIYNGNIRTIVLDNASIDRTKDEIMNTIDRLKMNDCEYVYVADKGKFNALNEGLKHVNTKYVITLDADTKLDKNAINNIVSRMLTSPNKVKAVAGSLLASNPRSSLIAKMQHYDYILSIASIKRMQGLYQGTLVAQGAFSLYDTQVVRDCDGWDNSIGEDIVLTWNILSKGYKVFYEPTAIAFTDVPESLKIFIRQRCRWARGLIEGLRKVKPWHMTSKFHITLTMFDIVIPYIDLSYTLVWIPGLIMAMFGKYYIVGIMTIFALPLTIISFLLLMYKQRKILKELELDIKGSKLGFILFILGYQLLMSPTSLYGYLQELLKMKRVWK